LDRRTKQRDHVIPIVLKRGFEGLFGPLRITLKNRDISSALPIHAAEGIDQAVDQGCWDFVCGRILG
jgi:hypothetical protein